MKNLSQKLAATALCATFISMQISLAGAYDNFNTGLGKGNGGAVINNATDGLVDVRAGGGKADLDFNANTHVNWDSLNVNSGETLNFNAVGGNNLTILNTVNHEMSNIYGQINANSGIGKLIISNPNGVLFDGAHFTTAGDLMITTQDMRNVSLDDLTGAKFTQLYADGKLIPVAIKGDSKFDIGGDYTIVAAGINAADSTIKAKNVRMVTANGQDYLALGVSAPTKSQTVAKLSAMNIDGNLYITNDAGALEIVNGGTVKGNTDINTSGNVILNKENNGKKLNLNGDVKVVGNGAQMFLRNADVKGKLDMENGGGFLDVADVNVAKDAILKTTSVSNNKVNCCSDVKHFVHVVGNSQVDGNLTIDAVDNIHIGGYNYDAKQLLDGKLTVGGDLTAHSKNGHIMTTIDTSANKISMTADTLNVLTDGKAVLSANEYEFSSNGYLGGLKTTPEMTVDEKIINIMENYIPIPDTVGTPGYVNISGGTISKLNTPDNASAYISSKGNLKVTGVNAGDVNITAPGKYIEITGENVHANTITVGKETDKLKVDFPGRDYTLKYTNIRDSKLTTVNKDEEVTYELTNGKNGYNTKTVRPSNTTYLVGPGATDTPDKPDVPVKPPVNPNKPIPNPDDNDNIKVLRSYENQSVDLNQVYTPVAYAADLDDDDVDTGVRKNVDGSVTVVRAFPMIN